MNQIEQKTAPVLVSIIIPTYNRAKDLDRALQSVIGQTYPHWECIVVDNHSTDDTDLIVRAFGDSRIKLFKVHNHGVIAISRNEGIRRADGKYLAFLDSDDWWRPLKIAASLNYLEQGIDVVYHDLYRVSKSNQRFFWRKVSARDLSTPVFDDLLKNGNALNNSSVMVRREVLSRINGLTEDPCFVGAEDYHAWLDISKCTEKFKRIPQTLGYYWVGGGNATSPERTIKHLDALEVRYVNDISRLVGDTNLSWMRYAKARAFYRLGEYALSKKMTYKIKWKPLPFFVVIKLIWIKCQLEFLRG